MRPKWWESVARLARPVVWALVAGLLAYRLGPQAAAALGVPLSLPDRAPDFQATTLDGAKLALADYRGQVVLINFWATWCPPCRLEMPALQRVYRQRKDEGFVVLAIAMDRGGDAEVRRFVAERELSFPVAMATAEVARAYPEVRALPTSLLVDRAGRIRHRVTGYFAEAPLRLALDRLIDEPVPAPDSMAVGAR